VYVYNYIVSVLEGDRQSVAHSGVVHRHEDRVDNDTDRYEHIDERIHDE